MILKHLRAINRIFSGFVSGKLLDSLIIGIICGICLSLLHMPYAMLISVIVGITNIIPVFGPFFGAIPSAFILLLTDPGKCLIFIVFVIILQQVDGNIIGPKILGDSTGLSAFWVLFALLLFNHLMGFWGMLLGVPLFASFYYLLREFINARLRKSPFLWRPRNTSMCPGLTRRAPSPICRPLSLSFILCSGGGQSVGPASAASAPPPLPVPGFPPDNPPSDDDPSS
ncbi:MAG: AI-2E family transporter [Evtepia gabavorous]